MSTIIKHILEKKANVNLPHLMTGYTALHLACIKNEPIEFVQLLLNHGADKNIKNLYGKIPLDYIQEYNICKGKN